MYIVYCIVYTAMYNVECTIVHSMQYCSHILMNAVYLTALNSMFSSERC